MKDLYNSQSGFRPSGKVLDYWKFLPQTQIDKDAPSLFGNFKSMLIPNVIVILLILCEAGLFYTMQEEGVSFMTLLALSIFDFIIGILPAIFFIQRNLIKSVINANIFIIETKLNIPNEVPPNYNGNEAKYHNDLKNNLDQYKAQKANYKIIEIIFIIGILALAGWKFASIYDVFGTDIFVLGIGRYVMVVLVLSIITHVSFTGIVFANIVFMILFKSQKQTFDRNRNLFSVNLKSKNSKKPVTFFGRYNFTQSGDQFVAKELEDDENLQEKDRSKVKEVQVYTSNNEDDSHTTYYSRRKTENNKGVNIIYTGILTDSEISELLTGQPDTGAEKAILATAKEIQLKFS